MSGWKGITRIVDDNGNIAQIVGGRLLVDADSTLQEEQTIFAEVGSIVKDSETDIVSYTVPAGKSAMIKRASGEAFTDTKFKMYLASGVKEKRHNNWCERNVDFVAGFKATEGQTVKITAEHGSDNTQTISANIVYIEY